jgi:hypothetical protein
LATDLVPGQPAVGDQFGAALTEGDFNGEGFCDLAVGIPHRSTGAVPDAGQVVIMYGSGNGISGIGSQEFSQNTALVLDASEAGDLFGAALAAGDFNGDDFVDLAIGVPAESIGAATHCGAVAVLFGSANGLTAVGNQLWHQNSNLIVNTCEAEDRFGSSLAAGFFNNDGLGTPFEDLAIGVPLEDLGAVDQGAVAVIYGSLAGLDAVGNQLWSQDSTNILDKGEAGDRFGLSLVASKFGNSGEDDLAIGVPFEDNDAVDCGAVQIIYGTLAGLSSAGNQFFTQNSPNILDSEEAGDNFGRNLAAGHINDKDQQADLFNDLVIGVPFESVGAVGGAGVIQVLYSGANGLGSTGNQLISQDTVGILNVCETNDFFGLSVAVTSFVDANGLIQPGDVIVGVPGEEGAAPDCGAIMVFQATPVGISTLGEQFFDQNTFGVPGTSQQGDGWGVVVGPR